LVDKLTVLPCTSVVPMRLLELQRNGTAGMMEIAEVLAADPGLSTGIIALTNAEVFGPVPVTKLSQAVSMIGLDNLLPLAFGLSLAGMFNPFALPADDRFWFWRSSLLKALIAREYAANHCPQFSEEAFLCGLVQDIALPIIYASDRSAWPETLATLAVEDDAERRERERSIYGTDHAELGRRIMTQVGMPEPYRAAIGAHHDGLKALESVGDGALAMALHVAAALPLRAPAQFSQLMAGKIARAIDGPNGRAEAISLLVTACDKHAVMIERLGESEELSVAYKESLQALCAEVAVSVRSAVHTSIAEISGLKARETTLQSKVAELAQRALQSDFDSLTKVLNRRGFMSRAPRVLAIACECRCWCGIGFVDMDNFKQLNDSMGHAAGDQALINVAARLRERLQSRGIVGRMGGDEFCFIMLATRMDDFAAEAEKVKAIFDGLRVESAGNLRDLTVSVGLFSLGAPPKLQDIGAAMKHADELMYGAKTSGKNRCVVGSV